MSGSYNTQPSERTEIITKSDNVIDAILKFASSTKTKSDACIDYTRPALTFNTESIRESLADIKAKGIRLRVIKEITAENISSRKQCSKEKILYATRYRVKIRVLTPLNDSITQLAQEASKFVDIRYIPEELQ